MKTYTNSPKKTVTFTSYDKEILFQYPHFTDKLINNNNITRQINRLTHKAQVNGFRKSLNWLVVKTGAH